MASSVRVHLTETAAKLIDLHSGSDAKKIHFYHSREAKLETMHLPFSRDILQFDIFIKGFSLEKPQFTCNRIYKKKSFLYKDLYIQQVIAAEYVITNRGAVFSISKGAL